MIYLCSEKMFTKNRKKLAKPADYFIVNSVEDGNSVMSSIKAKETSSFHPPVKMYTKKKESELILGINSEKKKDIFNNWIMSEVIPEFFSLWGIMALKRKHNIFIVMDNAPFKVLNGKIIKALNKFGKLDYAIDKLLDYVDSIKKAEKKNKHSKSNIDLNKVKKKLKKLLDKYDKIKDDVRDMDIVYSIEDVIEKTGKNKYSVNEKKLKRGIPKEVYIEYSEILVKLVDIHSKLIVASNSNLIGDPKF